MTQQTFKSKYDGAEIEIENWSQYNPRSETKRPSWFRFENDLAVGPKLFDLNSDQKWLLVVILSLISQKNGQPIIWNSRFIQSVTGILISSQDEALEKLHNIVNLKISERNPCESVRDPCESVRDSRLTNERDGRTDVTDSVRANFEMKEKIKECILVWGMSLKASGSKADPNWDEIAIGRKLKREPFEKVKFALIGAGLEPKHEGFDPAQHISIERTLSDKMFGKLVNIGSKQIQSERKTHDVKL